MNDKNLSKCQQIYDNMTPPDEPDPKICDICECEFYPEEAEQTTCNDCEEELLWI